VNGGAVSVSVTGKDALEESVADPMVVLIWPL
jgi:hypothetical protein